MARHNPRAEQKEHPIPPEDPEPLPLTHIRRLEIICLEPIPAGTPFETLEQTPPVQFWHEG